MDFEKNLLRKKILIVDDDNTLNHSIKEILITYGFQSITCTFSAKESIHLINTKEFDLIILDVMLPDDSGYTVAQYIRQYYDLPILFLTAKNNPEDEIQCLQIGGDDYIPKPFLPKNLVYRILSLLRRSYKNDCDNIIINDMIIDFKNAVIIKPNSQHALTPIELKLLHKLYANKNYIVSIEALCQTIWGVDYFGYENSLMVHIRKIREKIEVNPSTPTILITIRGLGYKLVI